MLLYVRRGLRNIFRVPCCLCTDGRRLGSGLLVGRGDVDACVAGGGWVGGRDRDRDRVWGCVRGRVRVCVCVRVRVCVRGRVRVCVRVRVLGRVGGGGGRGTVGGAVSGASSCVGEGEMAEVGC